MNAAAYLLNLVIRVLGASALALGLSFWLGYARSLTQLHMLLGIGLLLSLWAVAWIAWLSAGRGALAAFGVVWGILTLAFGVVQVQIFPGPLHWIVQLAHLAVGMIAIGLGTRLAVAISQRPVSAG